MLNSWLVSCFEKFNPIASAGITQGSSRSFAGWLWVKMCSGLEKLSFDTAEADMCMRIWIKWTFRLIFICLSFFCCCLVDSLHSLKNAEISVPFCFKVLTFELKGGESCCSGCKVGCKLHIFHCGLRAEVEAAVDKHYRLQLPNLIELVQKVS